MFGSAKRKGQVSDRENVVDLGKGSREPSFNFSQDAEGELSAFRQMIDSMPVNVMTLDLEDFTINYVNKTSVECPHCLERP